MRLTAFLLLAAMVVLAGCSSSPVAEVPKGEYDVTYAASVTTTPVEMQAAASAAESGGQPLFVKMEVRLIDVDRARAREMMGLAPDNLRALNDRPRAYAVERSKLAQLLDALRTREHAKIMGAPRLTCQDRQRGVVTLGASHSYVSGFEVTQAKGAVVADPMISTIQDGLMVSLRPEVGSDRKSVTLEVQLALARLVDPMQQFKTTAPGAKGEFTVQVPLLKCERMRTKALLPEGNTLVVTGLQAERADRVILVLVNVELTDSAK
ncbi:MAG: hypothetical protein IT462_01015 [Planctomycetes bacterium]|nr:hypothetical protein [Planctomycetota bacterium]